jgi:hypothetical protein
MKIIALTNKKDTKYIKENLGSVFFAKNRQDFMSKVDNFEKAIVSLAFASTKYIKQNNTIHYFATKDNNWEYWPRLLAFVPDYKNIFAPYNTIEFIIKYIKEGAISL